LVALALVSDSELSDIQTVTFLIYFLTVKEGINLQNEISVNEICSLDYN